MGKKAHRNEPEVLPRRYWKELGRLSDVELARRASVRPATVRRYRLERNLPACFPSKEGGLRDDILERLKGYGWNKVRTLFSRLEPRQAEVLEMRLFPDSRETLRVLSETLDVSRERVRQIEMDGLKNLLALVEASGGTKGKSKSPKLKAFGETKTIVDWGRDKRCRVSLTVLARRLADGWKPEVAIAVPHTGGGRPGTLLYAFGEARSLSEWTRDRRCKVSLTALTRRLIEGWMPEEALETPSPGRGRPGIPVEAFGRTQSVSAWGRDRRCQVSLHTLFRRLSEGWNAEEAISTPPHGGPRANRKKATRKKAKKKAKSAATKTRKRKATRRR